MTANPPKIGPQYPWDRSERGMPVDWYWFEQALEHGLKQEHASIVMQRTRDDLVNAVATDSYIAQCDLADRAWLRFCHWTTP